jgi:hypothetical protein
MNKHLIFLVAFISIVFPPLASAAEQVIVGKLLTATLSIYEQSDRSVLTTVVRVNDGSFMVVHCDLKNNNPPPAVDLREAHALMNAHIFAGSGTNIEVTAVSGSSVTGFPSYAMKSWKMSIPGLDAYRFDCAAAD